MAQTYSFVKSAVNSDLLSQEIRNSAILIALSSISYVQPTSLDITMKDVLSAGDQTILSDIVTAHSGDPTVGFVITKDTFLNNVASYSTLKYVKVQSANTDTTLGLVIPVNRVVGVYRVRLTGADSSMFVMMAFDYGGASQKIFSATRGSVDLYLDPKLPMNQVTGNGVKELAIICINDGANESPYIGGSFEATTISG